jgi:hypothetical protein
VGVLLALGGYVKGFRDGSMLSSNHLKEIDRLGRKLDAQETKLTLMETRLEGLKEENFNLKVMFQAVKEKNEELLQRLERYEPTHEMEDRHEP